MAASPPLSASGWLRIRSVLLIAAGICLAFGLSAEIPVRGGCILSSGGAPPAGVSEAAADVIRTYATLFRNSYSSFKGEERRIRRAISDLLDRKYWTQAEVTSFTDQQRALLYIGVAAGLARGRIAEGELLAYVTAVDRKIMDIELGLGCELLPQ